MFERDEVSLLSTMKIVGIQSVRQTVITSGKGSQSVCASPKGPATGCQFDIQFPPSLHGFTFRQGQMTAPMHLPYDQAL